MKTIASTLAPEAYCDAAVFSAEQPIWEQGWVPVAVASDLQAIDSFVTAQVGTKSVLVQRFAEGLSAFLNVCAHRHACLQSGRGVRPLSCPFHGWRYDRRGVLISAPFTEPGFVERNAGRPSLTPVALAQCGAVVFVHLGTPKQTLEEHLGEDIVCILKGLEPSQGPAFARDTQRWSANWKLTIESVLEGLHVPFAHLDTFAPLLRLKTSDIRLSGRHSVQTWKLDEEKVEAWRVMRNRLGLIAPRDVDPDTYTHLSVFPHLNIGITGGALVSTQFYWPVSVQETDLDFMLAFGPDKGSVPAGRRAMLAALQAQWAENNVKLLAEDRALTESVQRGMRIASKPAWLVPGEERLAHFHRQLESARG